MLQQEEAAARIRVNIRQYLDNLMARGAPVRKEWSRNGAIRCWLGERVVSTDPDTKQNYRDAGNYVYACALECALRGAPKAKWWVHDSSEEQAGDMIEIILGLAWMGTCKTLDHHMRRNAVEDLVRKTEKLIKIMPRTHHRYFAQHVQEALLRIANA